MAVESINAQAKEALTNALETAGYKVYPNIIDRHTGVRTKSVEYVELGRGFLRTSDEITDECIQGEFQIEMKYYKPNTWNANNGANDLTFEDCCIQVEKSISQVKTPGMFTRFNMDKEFPTTPHNRGKECRWVLSCTVASRQDRGEVAGPPINTAAPVVTGLGFEGQTLTTTDGSWTGSQPITYSYDWQANGVSLGAADQNTYVVGAGLEGQTITCVVTASNTFGDVAATSNGILIETAAAPVNTVAPVVTPDPPTEGDLLTSTDGTWTGNPAPTFTYQWYKDDGAGGAFSAIGGATSSTYQTTVGDAGFKFYCEVTGTNFVNSASADSNTVTAESAVVYPAFPKSFDFGEFSFKADSEPFGNTVNMRVITTPTDIQHVAPDGLFDTAAWNTATTSGANQGFATTAYDAAATPNNATQTTEAQQPEVLSDGSLIFDGAGDNLYSDFQFPVDAWSFAIVMKYNSGTRILDTRLDTNPSQEMFFFYQQANLMRLFYVPTSTIIDSTAVLAPIIGDGLYHTWGVSFDGSHPTAGYQFYLDGSPLTMATNLTGNYPVSEGGLNIMDIPGGGVGVNGGVRSLVVSNSTWTNQDHLDVHTWYNDGGYIGA